MNKNGILRLMMAFTGFIAYELLIEADIEWHDALPMLLFMMAWFGFPDWDSLKALMRKEVEK